MVHFSAVSRPLPKPLGRRCPSLPPRPACQAAALFSQPFRSKRRRFSPTLENRHTTRPRATSWFCRIFFVALGRLVSNTVCASRSGPKPRKFRRSNERKYSKMRIWRHFFGPKIDPKNRDFGDLYVKTRKLRGKKIPAPQPRGRWPRRFAGPPNTCRSTLPRVFAVCRSKVSELCRFFARKNTPKWQKMGSGARNRACTCRKTSAKLPQIFRACGSSCGTAAGQFTKIGEPKYRKMRIWRHFFGPKIGPKIDSVRKTRQLRDKTAASRCCREQSSRSGGEQPEKEEEGSGYR